MSKWIEVQEVVVSNPVYVGPGSEFLSSPWMTVIGVIAAAYCFHKFNEVIRFR